MQRFLQLWSQFERQWRSSGYRPGLETLDERLPPGDLAGSFLAAHLPSFQQSNGTAGIVRSADQSHLLREPATASVVAVTKAGANDVAAVPVTATLDPEAVYPRTAVGLTSAEVLTGEVDEDPFAVPSMFPTNTRRHQAPAPDASALGARTYFGGAEWAAPALTGLVPLQGVTRSAASPVTTADTTPAAVGLFSAVSATPALVKAPRAVASVQPEDGTGDSARSGPSQDVGYVGCSMTLNAVGGYQQVGGARIWTEQGDYGGGGITQWAQDLSDQSRYWGSFRTLLNANPNTTAIWLQLCTTQGNTGTDNLTNAIVVVQEIYRRVPWTRIYVSAQPAYTAGHVCQIAGQGGPERMQAITEQLVQQGHALPGPVVGPLSAAQTLDGCHANLEGRRLMGQQLVAFYDRYVRPAPTGIFCSCGPTTGVGEGSVASNIARLDFVTGILVRIGWNVLEPSDDLFRWDLIDQQVARARQYGKTVTLAVVNGPSAPDWLFSQAGAVPFWFQNFTRRMPVPWDEVYLREWTELVAQLGARYRNDPTVVMVTITNATGNGFEMQLPSTPSDIANWNAYGYRHDLVTYSWIRITDAFAAAFPATPLELELHPVLNSNQVPYDTMYYAWYAYETRVGVFAGWWSQRNTTVYPGPWELLQWGPYLSFSSVQFVTNATQNPTGFGEGGIQRAIDLAYDTGIRYMEIWNQDLLNTSFDGMLRDLAERLRG